MKQRLNLACNSFTKAWPEGSQLWLYALLGLVVVRLFVYVILWDIKTWPMSKLSTNYNQLESLFNLMKDLLNFFKKIRVNLCASYVEWNQKLNGFRNTLNVKKMFYLNSHQIQVSIFFYVISVTHLLFLRNSTLKYQKMIKNKIIWALSSMQS